MQIHELDSFTGQPTSTDYLVIDDGSETKKIPAPNVGATVPDAMTQSEAENGVNTNTRVISPYIMKKAINAHAPIPSAMTQNEAEAGSVTDTRVISPKVLKDSVKALAGTADQITATDGDGNNSTVQNVLDSMVLKSGDSVTVSMAGLSSYITASSKQVSFFVPIPFIKGTVTINSLSIALRHPEGLYPFCRVGTTYTQLGSSPVAVKSNGTLADAVDSIAVGSKSDFGFSVNVVFKESLTKASNNTTAVTNNVPMGVYMAITIDIT